jgi:multicomponent Na+:H+ antiporter subunit E
MTTFLLNILLAMSWIALTGTFTPTNLIIGFVLGYAVLAITQRLMAPSGYFSRVPKVLSFALFFLWELANASVRVAIAVVLPRMNIRPAVVAVPLDVRSNGAISLLANLITLTPGTLYLDVSADRRVMYIHIFHVDDLDEFRQHIKHSYERRVMEILE